MLDDNGQIASYGCGRPFDMANTFADIGVLTRADCRGKGLGAAVVAAVCPRLMRAGLEPLYRCDEDNVGSVRLSASMGFTPATTVTAFRFTPASL